MAERTIGFLGGGRVVGILLAGWERAGCLPRHVLVADTDGDVLARLRQRFPSIEIMPGDNKAAASRELVFVAVHPPILTEILTEIRPVLSAESLLISLAPKFSIARMSEILGGFSRLGRCIPNAPSQLNQGFNPLCFSADVTDTARAGVRELFAALGPCPEVAEEKLEAYALLTAMGPTYFWPQFQILLELSCRFGLTEAEATEGLAEMLRGTLAMQTDSGLDEAALMNLIPVKPLGNELTGLVAAYREQLSSLYEKIRA